MLISLLDPNQTFMWIVMSNFVLSRKNDIGQVAAARIDDDMESIHGIFHQS